MLLSNIMENALTFGIWFYLRSFSQTQNNQRQMLGKAFQSPLGWMQVGSFVRRVINKKDFPEKIFHQYSTLKSEVQYPAFEQYQEGVIT